MARTIGHAKGCHDITVLYYLTEQLSTRYSVKNELSTRAVKESSVIDKNNQRQSRVRWKLKEREMLAPFMGSERWTLRDWLLSVEDGCWSDTGKQKQLEPTKPIWTDEKYEKENFNSNAALSVSNISKSIRDPERSLDSKNLLKIPKF